MSKGTARLLDRGSLDQTWGQSGLSVDWQLLLNILSGPDAISIQPVHHTLTCHMDSGGPLAPVRPSTGVRPHPDETDRTFRPIPLTGSCPAEARTSREMSSSYHYKVCRLTFIQGHCRIFPQQHPCTQTALNISMEGKERVNKQIGFVSSSSASYFRRAALKSQCAEHSGCC
ncbi:hypothetical protein PBY51_004441 [Eleginops maclovinus]|uniref:Uncharacterized protein n=1 Tax=Eleginops maclovinus TaxID=56733 RepID=A0AAN7Y013_ELEMC|nr:hypothetical protein PBY51_004441 [Eleginops maclovinus]